MKQKSLLIIIFILIVFSCNQKETVTDNGPEKNYHVIASPDFNGDYYFDVVNVEIQPLSGETFHPDAEKNMLIEKIIIDAVKTGYINSHWEKGKISIRFKKYQDRDIKE